MERVFVHCLGRQQGSEEQGSTWMTGFLCFCFTDGLKMSVHVSPLECQAEMTAALHFMLVRLSMPVQGITSCSPHTGVHRCSECATRREEGEKQERHSPCDLGDELRGQCRAQLSSQAWCWENAQGLLGDASSKEAKIHKGETFPPNPACNPWRLESYASCTCLL